MTTNEPTEKNVSELEARTRRALEEYMTVLPEEETGLCRVYTQSGEEYVVDAVEGACTCPDVRHNLGHDGKCKHQRRARFALGMDAVPADAVEELDVDEALGRHTDASLRFVASDGGVVEADDVRESEDSRANENAPRSHDDAEVLTDAEEEDDECEECAELSDLPCFECWMRERGFKVEESA